MQEMHLFAGAGGGILGGMLLGHTTVCAVEINPYCRGILLQRQRDGILPRFPIWDDVKTFDGKPWKGRVDVVCGGFPCTDISSAGKGKGIKGEKSGLWTEMARIIGEVEPRYVFVENSPMLVSRGLESVLFDLAELGYDARWGIVGAAHVGAPHIRQRIWILAFPSSIGMVQSQFQHENTDARIGSCKVWNKKRFPRILAATEPWHPDQRASFRMDDGVARRVGRVEAVGNGQVPLVAAYAWKLLGGP